MEVNEKLLEFYCKITSSKKWKEGVINGKK